MDDCYSDMEEPLYGFRSKVVLTENSPCQLGSTCRGVPEDDLTSQLNPDLQLSLQQQQNGQYYGSSTFKQYQHNDQNILQLPKQAEEQEEETDQYLDNSIERQTGEDFSSDGPPDCRVTFDPSRCRRF